MIHSQEFLIVNIDGRAPSVGSNWGPNIVVLRSNFRPKSIRPQIKPNEPILRNQVLEQACGSNGHPWTMMRAAIPTAKTQWTFIQDKAEAHGEGGWVRGSDGQTHTEACGRIVGDLRFALPPFSSCPGRGVVYYGTGELRCMTLRTHCMCLTTFLCVPGLFLPGPHFCAYTISAFNWRKKYV